VKSRPVAGEVFEVEKASGDTPPARPRRNKWNPSQARLVKPVKSHRHPHVKSRPVAGEIFEVEKGSDHKLPQRAKKK
jgi:hypothetical protein